LYYYLGSNPYTLVGYCRDNNIPHQFFYKEWRLFLASTYAPEELYERSRSWMAKSGSPDYSAQWMSPLPRRENPAGTIIAWHLLFKPDFDAAWSSRQLLPSVISGRPRNMGNLDILAGDDEYIFWGLVPFNKPDVIFPEDYDQTYLLGRKWGFGVDAAQLINHPETRVRQADFRPEYKALQKSVPASQLQQALLNYKVANEYSGAQALSYVEQAEQACRTSYIYQSGASCPDYREIEILWRGPITLDQNILRFVVDDGKVCPLRCY